MTWKSCNQKEKYMWMFKTKKGILKTAVIHDDCYAKLPDTLKNRFCCGADDAEITHVVYSQTNGDDDEEFVLLDAGYDVDFVWGVRIRRLKIIRSIRRRPTRHPIRTWAEISAAGKAMAVGEGILIKILFSGC